MSMFYKSVVESVLNLRLLNWYGDSSSVARGNLKRIVTSAKRLGYIALALRNFIMT